MLAALSPNEARTSFAEVGPLATGTRVGRYVVLGLLGEGGMGRVHVAYDPELDRKVALKLLKPRAFREDSLAQARQRLEREARTMARLSHPHVASLHDVGEYQGQLFLVMEFLEGGTLRRWLTEQAAPAGGRCSSASGRRRMDSPRRTRWASSTATSSRTTSC